MGDTATEYGKIGPFSGIAGQAGAWWWHYQPVDYTIGNYQLGTEQDYKEMCDVAHSYGVKIITDVVANHTTKDYTKVSDNLLSAVGINTTNRPNATSDEWKKLYHKGWNTKQSANHNNRYQTTFFNLEGSSSDYGLRDTNTENPHFQAYLIETYLNQLLKDGCDGFRYDTAKHIAVCDDDNPSNTNGEPNTPNDFWDAVTGKKTVQNINDETVKYNQEYENGTWSNIKSTTPFIYGEALQGSNGTPYSEYTKYMKVTASTYGYYLCNDLRSRDFKTSDIKSNWAFNGVDSSKLVTWVESHDTYCNEHRSADLEDDQIRKGWAVVAARSGGTPLFFSRPDGSTRQNYWGKNKIGEIGNSEFQNEEVTAVNHFHNAMANVGATSEKLRYVHDCTKILQIDRYKSGDISQGKCGTVIVNLSDMAYDIDTVTEIAAGEYYDSISGNCFTVYTTNGKNYIKGHIGADSISVIYLQPSITLGASSNSCEFQTDKLTVTLNTDGTDAKYILNDSTETVFTNGTALNIGENDDVSTSSKTTKLVIKATDANGKILQRHYTYVKRSSADMTYVYFNKSAYSSWSTVYAYFYAPDGNGFSYRNSSWPGIAMTDTEESTGYYRMLVPYALKNANAVFSDNVNSTNRYPADGAGGLALNGKNMLFGASNSWSEYNGTVPVIDNATIADSDIGFDTYRYVYFFNSVGWKTDAEHPISVTLSNDTNTYRTGNMTYSDTLHCYYYKYGLSHNYNSITFKGTNGSNTACTIQVSEPTNGFAGRLFVPSTDSEGTWSNINAIKEYKVYFNNSQNWSNVNVYLWSSTGDYVNAAWPGSAMTSIGTVSSYTKVYSCTYYSPVEYDRVKFNIRIGGNDQTYDTEYSSSSTNTDIYSFTSTNQAATCNSVLTSKSVTVEIAYANEKAPTMTDTDTVTSVNKTTQLADKVSVTNNTYPTVVTDACENMSMTNVYDTYTFHSASQFDYLKSLASETDSYINTTLPRAAYTNPASFAHPSTAFGGANITAADKLKRYNSPADNGEWVEFYSGATKVETDKVSPDLGNVDKIRIWSVSMPRTYTVNFNINGTPYTENCSYNQLLSTTTQNNIKTAIENSNQTFDGWYIKDGTKELKISSEPDYKYRITQSRTLYAKFRTTDRPDHKATAIADPIDVFSENGTTMYRYNTLLNICDLGDSDSNISQVGIVYVKPNDGYSVSTIGNDIQSHISSIDSYTPTNYTILKSAVYNVGDGTTNTVTLTTKNRLQFNLKLTQAQATNEGKYANVLAYTVYNYNGTWHVSENCVHYKGSTFTEIE